MNARLYADTGVEVGHRTVQRYLKKLGLTLLPNDILDGKVTMDQVYNAIHDARNNLLQNNTGYCRMRMVLMRHYNIRVPRVSTPSPLSIDHLPYDFVSLEQRHYL
ncbi:hypothetical protein KEM48_006913 [Puccinia striiformis f. sp. tritici PST-130]|nr:hypothetical protein KEM48_006913 [Puccinia striiformis f. sp. tritici PST-130]